MISDRADAEALSEACANDTSRRSTRPPRDRLDRGSVVVELVILAPVLVALMLFVVLVGRGTGATEQVRHAADEGARAASLVSRGAMVAAATSTVQRDLLTNGANCGSTNVSVTVTGAAGAEAVTVTVSCAVNGGGTNLLGAAARTVTAQSTEVIDRHRAG